MPTPVTLGADLRALRKSRGLTLETLGERLGVSVGWLSQVERDISTPDRAALKQIAAELDAPLSLFVGQPSGAAPEVGRIVRADQRREIGEREVGLVEALLSPDLTDDFEVIHSTFLPGSSRQEAVLRPTQELAYLVSGQLDIWLDGEFFQIFAGDSFRVRGQEMRWSNPYPTSALAIWVIAPPVY